MPIFAGLHASSANVTEEEDRTIWNFLADGYSMSEVNDAFERVYPSFNFTESHVYIYSSSDCCIIL